MHQEEEEESKAQLGFKASVDLFMGVIYAMISFYCIKNPGYLKQFGNMENQTIYIIMAMFLFYGIFRLYRGMQTFRKFNNRRR